MAKQHREDQSGGGNASTYSKNRLHQPPAFQGKSGQGDNRETKRPAGKS